MRMFLGIAIIAVFVLTSFCAANEGTIKVGDPLTIFIRRSPVQNLTFLHLYKAFNSSVEDKNQYVLVLGPKGSGTDVIVAYLPASGSDNGLKYGPNSSVQGSYNFSLLGRAIKGLPDVKYRIKVTVEIDYRRKGDFRSDKNFDFIIEGPSDSKVHYKEGGIGVSSDDLKKMDPSSGGRLRITISRDDNEDNSVILYTGYMTRNCGLTLPMSRIGSEGTGSGNASLFIVLAVVSIAIGAIVAYFALDHLSGKKKANDKGKGKRR